MQTAMHDQVTELEFSECEVRTLLSLLIKCTEISSPTDIMGIFRTLSTMIPFTYSACGIVTLQSSHFEVVYCEYPREFAALYMSKGLASEPSLTRLKETKEVIATSEDVPNAPRPEIDALKAEYEIRNCISMAMRGQLGFCLYVAISNYAEAHKERILQVLRLIASNLHHACTRAVIPWDLELKEAEAIMKHLTTQQEEVLRWVLAGKTAFEIGTIMNIRERTVRFHLEQITAVSPINPSRWHAHMRMMIDGALQLQGPKSILSPTR